MAILSEPNIHLLTPGSTGPIRIFSGRLGLRFKGMGLHMAIMFIAALNW